MSGVTRLRRSGAEAAFFEIERDANGLTGLRNEESRLRRLGAALREQHGPARANVERRARDGIGPILAIHDREPRVADEVLVVGRYLLAGGRPMARLYGRQGNLGLGGQDDRAMSIADRRFLFLLGVFLLFLLGRIGGLFGLGEEASAERADGDHAEHQQQQGGSGDRPGRPLSAFVGYRLWRRYSCVKRMQDAGMQGC